MSLLALGADRVFSSCQYMVSQLVCLESTTEDFTESSLGSYIVSPVCKILRLFGRGVLDGRSDRTRYFFLYASCLTEHVQPTAYQKRLSLFRPNKTRSPLPRCPKRLAFRGK